MKKTIPFDLFGEKTQISFNILSLAEFEKAMGKSIQHIIKSEDEGINFCLTALPICLEKKSPHLYAKKISEYLENGGRLNDISAPIVHAIIASGVIGKVASEAVMQLYYPELYPEIVEAESEKN